MATNESDETLDAQVRQSVRVGLAAAAFGIITGVMGTMALFPRHGGNLPATEPTQAVAPAAVADSAPARASASSIVPAEAPSEMAERVVAVDDVAKQPPPAARTSGAVEAPKITSVESPSASDKPCTEATWPYFDSKCLWGPAPNEALPSVHTPARAASAVTADAAANRSEPHRAATSKKVRTANSSKRRRDAPAAFASSPFGFQTSPFGGRVGDGARYGRRGDSRSGWPW